MRRRLAFLGCVLALAFGPSPARAQTGPLAPAVRATLEAGTESAELRELREFEERTFGASATQAASEGPAVTSTEDVSFLAGATLPDLPARWDDAVVRYLVYFRDDPRGQALMRAWYRRAARYDASIRDALRASSVPEDLRCVALAESGFDPTVRSPVGALGMWQFMADTGAQYGLARDRFVDERMDPDRATRSAARYLRDLQRRFGSWELALAAYNMGYGSLLRAIRKYNTNDYATLARVEAGLPFETTVYVSKIVACGIVLRNPERFGLADVIRDAPLVTSTVSVPGGTPLSRVASMANVSEADLTTLNPHLVRGIVPPSRATYDVRVPASARATYEAAATATRTWPDRAATLRFGERPADFAARFGLDERELRARNRFADTERIVGPVALSIPNVEPRARRASTANRPTVPVPAGVTAPAGRRRVFYQVIDGDELDAIATFFEVEVDDVVHWNGLDARARLQSGQTLQIFAPSSVDLERAIVLAEADVRIVVSGSEEFFDWFETNRGRVRARYRVQSGDTLGAVAERFGLTLGDLARINRLPRGALLRVGQELVVYTSRDLVGAPSVRADSSPAATTTVPATTDDSPAP